MNATPFRRLAGPAVFLFALAWMGCEGSPVPLSDPPSVPVDPTYLGTWEMASPEEEAGDIAVVHRFNDFEYLVEYREVSLADDGTAVFDEVQLLRMFVTHVDGRPFLNVKGVAADDEDWFFFELETVDAAQARLRVVSDDLYEDLGDTATTESVLAALREMIRSPEGYGDSAVFRRVEN